MNYIPYYGVCALLWFVAWAIGLWYCQTRRTRGPLLRRLSWPRRIGLMAGVVGLPVLYIFSYPLYQRLAAAFPQQRSWLGPMDDLYVPVQCLEGPSWSDEPFLWALALLAIVLTPFVVNRIVLSTRARHPRVVAMVLVATLAIGCFLYMLGPI